VLEHCASVQQQQEAQYCSSTSSVALYWLAAATIAMYTGTVIDEADAHTASVRRAGAKLLHQFELLVHAAVIPANNKY
jgi:hypothetical protein